MYCGKCGKEISEGQTICEDCTNKLKTNNNENGKSTIKKSVKIALIIIISIILLSVIITIVSNSTLKKANNLKENIETNSLIENEGNEQQNKDIYTDFDVSVSEMKQYIDDFDNTLKKQGSYKTSLANITKWSSATQTISPYYPLTIKTYYYNGKEVCAIYFATNNDGDIIGMAFMAQSEIINSDSDLYEQAVANDCYQLMVNMAFYLEKLTGDKELREYLINKLESEAANNVFLFNEYKKGIKFGGGATSESQEYFKLDFVLEKYATNFISKEDMQNYLDDIMGNFVGIGIYMNQNTEYDRMQVVSTIKGGSAEKAGIKAGDIILTIDGVIYTANQMTEASNSLKGQEGTNVTVEILRDGTTLKFDLTRATVKVNQVEGEVISNNIGYIQVKSFDETTAEDFKKKFEELNTKGIKSLIIDLRDNGGGIVDKALEIADYIVDKDSVLLYIVDKNNNEIVKKASKDPIINMPVIVLTNKYTAGASEILTGALQDLGKANVVGEKTYGKGVIQNILSLSDGSGKITNEGEYLTPNKKRIQDTGIEPNETVILQDVASEDTQLQRAIELLH